MGLESINGLAYDQAADELRACCAADAWVEEVLDRQLTALTSEPSGW